MRGLFPNNMDVPEYHTGAVLLDVKEMRFFLLSLGSRGIGITLKGVSSSRSGK